MVIYWWCIGIQLYWILTVVTHSAQSWYDTNAGVWHRVTGWYTKSHWHQKHWLMLFVSWRQFCLVCFEPVAFSLCEKKTHWFPMCVPILCVYKYIMYYHIISYPIKSPTKKLGGHPSNSGLTWQSKFKARPA